MYEHLPEELGCPLLHTDSANIRIMEGADGQTYVLLTFFGEGDAEESLHVHLSLPVDGAEQIRAIIDNALTAHKSRFN